MGAKRPARAAVGGRWVAARPRRRGRPLRVATGADRAAGAERRRPLPDTRRGTRAGFPTAPTSKLRRTSRRWAGAGRPHRPAGGAGPSGWLLGPIGPPAPRSAARFPTQRARAAAVAATQARHCPLAPRSSPLRARMWACAPGQRHLRGGVVLSAHRIARMQIRATHDTREGLRCCRPTIYLPRLRLLRTIYLPPPRLPPLTPPMLSPSTPTSAAVASSCRLLHSLHTHHRMPCRCACRAATSGTQRSSHTAHGCGGMHGTCCQLLSPPGDLRHCPRCRLMTACRLLAWVRGGFF
ncbi:hypothetical protein T492DRAFT_923820, partial [Pavlovales sp. CCMP2436]